MTTVIGPTLDLLANNAVADGRWPSVSAIDFEVAGEVMEVNAIAPVHITQAVLPLLAKRGGTVVMITSLMGSIADCMSGRSYAYRVNRPQHVYRRHEKRVRSRSQ